METESKSPFAISNIRLFIAFRIFFTARFYYPIFTILFLDFGLSLEQFALLNVAWAASIVVCEVPSGALADIVGRRNLLVATGILMVIEMTILCFVPLGNPELLFALFLLNRVIGGAAEAAASGADEALAYDSLKEEGDINDWGHVLNLRMRFQSIAFIIAMSLGAAVYDPMLMQQIADFIGLKVNLNQSITLRFPLYLNLGMAVMTLIAAWKMREISGLNNTSPGEKRSCGKAIIDAARITLQAGLWILKTPFALAIILAGLVFDNIIRMAITISSQYFRVIQIPEALFGIIGSGLFVMGLFIPPLALKLVNHKTPVFNLGVIASITFLGLWGMMFTFPLFGLIPMLLLFGVMFMCDFFLSHYLNRITSSEQRATVLSFKGLSFNLAYGAVGILFALLLAKMKLKIELAEHTRVLEDINDAVFIDALAWFPGYFLVTFAVFILFACWRLRGNAEYKSLG